MLVDTHAHLNLENYQHDWQEVVQRAWDNNVKKIIIPGLNAKTNEKAIQLSLKNSMLQVAVGIHPCYCLNENPLSIEQYLKNPSVIAVGETGLDLYHGKDSLDLQKKYFQVHIELALKYDLPLILHAREAFEEVYKMLLPYKGKIRGVFHCLVNNYQEVIKALDLGFYIGVGGIITYHKAQESHHIIKKIPLEKVLLETDSPFLTPEPFDNKHRNEPAYIKIIANKIAFLKKISLEKVATITTENVDFLFKKKY